jgi:hypothetical protein
MTACSLDSPGRFQFREETDNHAQSLPTAAAEGKLSLFRAARLRNAILPEWCRANRTMCRRFLRPVGGQPAPRNGLHPTSCTRSPIFSR